MAMRPLAVLTIGVLAAAAPAARGQDSAAAPPSTVCGMLVPAPAVLPPSDSGPVVLAHVLCFDAQGGSSMIDPQTYIFYIQSRPSEPSKGIWVAYDEAARERLVADFGRLWQTGFLDDLSIEAIDYPLANGVLGKVVLFRLEERQRVKLVEYVGSDKVSQSDIETALKEKSLVVRLDAFVDESLLRKVATVVRELYSRKGYQFAEVHPKIVPIASGAKLVRVSFQITEGPRIRIRDIEFTGNRAFSDRELSRAVKGNRPEGLLSLVTSKGVYDEEKFADDAQGVVDFYRDRGYVDVRVGQPELRPLDDAADGRTRWAQLRIPVIEGARYRIGDLTFEGNTVAKSEGLLALFELKPGETYSHKRVQKGFERARELYGRLGYSEFTAYPDLRPRKTPPDPSARGVKALPVLDVVIKMDEGRQYFVRRVAITGNTLTRDEVVRRELALYEAGVFNTEALKYSVRRLNQLGYFKPLDEKAVDVQKAPGEENKVDITLKVEEQNRNQVSFGVGTSEYDGFFGHASFATSNFLGRGETLSVSAQKGTRTNAYQVGVTEPYIFGRPVSLGATVFSRKYDYSIYTSGEVDYSRVGIGATVTAGMPLRRFLRFYTAYAYEVVDTSASDALSDQLAQGGTSAGGLSLYEGNYRQSSATSSLVYDTVDNPMTPRRGMRLSASYQYSGGPLGGTVDFIRPEFDTILYVPVTSRTALGLHGSTGWITNYGSAPLPYYLRYALGGETQIRGTNIRTVGPLTANNAMLGGDKFVLFNAEYYYDLVPAVRALLFHDAGQAFDEAHAIDFRELRTSSGVEVRVTMPVINAPFRLIYAWNVYRDAFQPARTFKFAVGTTF